MTTIGQRIAELRERLGLSQDELGEVVGMSQQGIQSIEGGKSNRPRKIIELARALKTTPEYLLTGEYPPSGNAVALPAKSHADDATERKPSYVRVVGEVAAGQWREVTYSDFDEFNIPVVIDCRWNPQDVFALVVKGNSINRQAKDGSYVVCLQAYAAPRGMKDGDWIVVERVRGDLVETTVKKAVALQDGGWSLRPDSDDPRHQEDIPLDATRCAGCDEVRVSAYVLDFIKPATRF